ncbi:MAG: proton-conducting transporter membrane subunit, partial [Candidatus Margulisiibacteriota bacterium]
YLVLSVVASVLMLTGIALFLITAGNTSFPAIKHVIESGSGGFLVKAGIAFFISGLFIKGGMVPFHGWLPDAYTSAPAPVSVFLAGIVTKASGLFALVKLCTFVFGFSLPVKEALMFVGTASIVVGALAALGQKNMKRMLAYSSISQMGYIVLSLGTGTKLGILAAMFHFFNHAIFKAQLFANSAAVEEQVATRNMDEMGGLGAKMPVTATTSIIAMLSTCGIPPLAGFWSKLLIVIALWVSGYHLYAGIAILASVITLAYFLSLQRRVFFGKVATAMEGVKEASFGLLFPALFLAGINIFVGLMFLFPSTWKLFLR